jgi:hypothetical protein
MSGDITSDNIQLSEPIHDPAPANVECAGPLPAALSCDDAEVLRFVAAARSPNTRRAYQSDVEHFIAWGGTIPADVSMIARYLARQATDLTSTTLARRMVGIWRAHLDRGFDDPTKEDSVRTVLRGIRRVHARPQNRVAPLVVEELLAICERLGDSLRDIRDRALLLVGFAGAFRRSELVAVDVEDIEKAAAGVVINIRRSKTDQECHGRKVAVQYGHSALCPVQALDRWLSVSGTIMMFLRWKPQTQMKPVNGAACRSGVDGRQISGACLWLMRGDGSGVPEAHHGLTIEREQRRAKLYRSHDFAG